MSEWQWMRLLMSPESVRWSPAHSSSFFDSILPSLLLLQLSPPLPAALPFACAPHAPLMCLECIYTRAHHFAIWPKKENCLSMLKSVKWAIKKHSTVAFTHLQTTWSQLMELWLWSMQDQRLISDQLTPRPCCLTPSCPDRRATKPPLMERRETPDSVTFSSNFSSSLRRCG